MKVTMYHSRDDWEILSEIPSIVCLICDDQKITIKHIVDKKKVLETIKSGFNPGWDSEVIVTSDGTIVKDYFDLVKWIDTKGLRLC